MKIAVLFVGQPRFFDITASFYLEWLDGRNVDFFGHFWSYVSYGPHQVEEELNVNKLEKIISTCPFKDFSITNYNNLDSFIQQIDGKFKLKDRYRHGEHYSTIQAIQLMSSYEKHNNITYDVVLRVRTDYLPNKQNLDELLSFSSNIPTVKVPNFEKGSKLTGKHGCIPTHLRSYNRSGINVFANNVYNYYIKFRDAYCNNKDINFVNFTKDSVFSFDRDETTLQFNSWHRGCAMSILIHGFENNSNIELLSYNLIRLVNNSTKSKFTTGVMSKYSTPVLSNYCFFNQDNSKCLSTLNERLR
tara:strand:+ start:1042 stop:1947 length:906 start_codon:yes stop_codon:yes gene_type:complete